MMNLGFEDDKKFLPYDIYHCLIYKSLLISHLDFDVGSYGVPGHSVVSSFYTKSYD